MSTRKIQRTGGASYAITLPKEWLLHWDLSDTSVVDIRQLHEYALIVTPKRMEKVTKAMLYIESMTDAEIEREIVGVYVSGVNEIHLQSETFDSHQRALVRSICGKLFGFELYDSVHDQMVLKNVSTSTVSPSEYINRMLTITISMFQDAIDAIKKHNKNLAHDVIERDTEVDKIHLLTERIFNMEIGFLIVNGNGSFNFLDMSFVNKVGIRLERIADHVVRIARTVTSSTPDDWLPLERAEMRELAHTLGLLQSLDTIINVRNRKASHEMIDSIYLRKANEYKHKVMKNTNKLAIIIDDSCGRIQSYIINIAEEVLNYTSAKKIF